MPKLCKCTCNTHTLFSVSLSSVSWVDVAAVCAPHHQCHSIRGGVRQTHRWLHGPVPERSDYIAESRSVHSLKMLTSQNPWFIKFILTKSENLLTVVPSCFFCLQLSTFAFCLPSVYLFGLNTGAETLFWKQNFEFLYLFNTHSWYFFKPFKNVITYALHQSGSKLFTFCCVVLCMLEHLAPCLFLPAPVLLSLHLSMSLRLSVATLSGCLEVLLIRMCRAFNVNNSTIFFNGKFAPAHFFKALGEDQMELCKL